MDPPELKQNHLLIKRILAQFNVLPRVMGSGVGQHDLSPRRLYILNNVGEQKKKHTAHNSNIKLTRVRLAAQVIIP